MHPDPMLLNDPIRSRQDIGRDRQPDLFGSFEIYHQFELRWLLHGEVVGLRAFENSIHVGGCALIQIANTRAVAHKPSVVHDFRST
jgi:hypothetical protein